jgi:hypothetical protein
MQHFGLAAIPCNASVGEASLSDTAGCKRRAAGRACTVCAT